MRQCKGCGATFTLGETRCPYCGTPLVEGVEEAREPQKKDKRKKEREPNTKSGGFADAFREGYRSTGGPGGGASSFRGSPRKEPPPLEIFRDQRADMLIAALLAFCLGTFGAQWFYLGNYGKGIRRALFFWTGIPTIMGFVEGAGFLRRLPPG